MPAKTKVVKTEAEPGTALAVPDERKEVAVVTDRPLNQGQVRNLEKIIGGDFADLRQRVEYEIRARYSRKVEAVNAQYDDPSVAQKARVEIEAAFEKARVVIAAAESKVRQRGLTIRNNTPLVPSLPVFQVESTGKKNELTRLQAAFERVLRNALNNINSQERQFQRKILLSSISTQMAADLINDVPEMGDIFALVEAELAVANADDLKTMGFTD